MLALAKVGSKCLRWMLYFPVILSLLTLATLQNFVAFNGEEFFNIPGGEKIVAAQRKPTTITDTARNEIPGETIAVDKDFIYNVDYDVCIVGAGLSGAVLAERYSAKLSKSVLVLDKRDHIGGNCYDYIDEITGLRISQYGAHLFHTKYKHVWEYVKRFGTWVDYEHKVRGIVNGKIIPIPVNIETVNLLFGLNIQNSAEMDDWLAKEQIGLVGKAQNSEQVALSRVGRRLYDLIFRPYTVKQWAKDPAELGPEVLSRIPVRNNHDDRYFSDPFQALPEAGYTAIFEEMLSSPLITLKIGVDYFQVRDQLSCGKTYYTGPIDAYFADTGWPKLEYRSLDFERVVVTKIDRKITNVINGHADYYYQQAFVVNHPQNDSDFTRIVEYKHLPNQPPQSAAQKRSTVYFVERSKDDGEPYYPVPNEKNKALYRKYQQLAEKEPDVTFVGRLANYKYFNMDEAIKNALELFAKDTGISAIDAIEDNNGLPEGLVSYAEELKHYQNLPPVAMTSELVESVKAALMLPIDEPGGLRHKAHPPGRDAVMGLAAYPTNMQTFRLLVGSLRYSGYDGHIILGVHKDIPQEEEEYLQKMDVTYYISEFVDCDPSIMDAGTDGGNIRGKCLKGLEKLKVEWGRFELCRQWLASCTECTGWNLVMDTRDIFFQMNPFASLPSPEEAKEDLLFIEEISPHTNPKPDDPKRSFAIGNTFYVGRTENCYGKEHFAAYLYRPVLCSGTIIGTRSGMHRMLSVLVSEFHANNAKDIVKCRSPHTTDQWTMNYLYYNGRFGEFNRTKTVPWGTGPVNTIGTPCVNPTVEKGPRKHSQTDLTVIDNATNLIVNVHEPLDSPARISAVVHQFDRCFNWIHPWLKDHHPEFNQKRDGKYTPIEELSLAWK